MNPKKQASYDIKATVLKALAHPTRLFIVEELSTGPRCVCELTEMIGADVSTVSKHLSQLKQAGIIEDDKQGLKVFYSLKVPCVMGFLGCVEAVLKSNAKAQLAAVK